MGSFSDYTIINTINETQYSIINLVKNKNDNKNYIMKELRSSNPSESEIARFRQEYNIIKNANIDGVISVYDILFNKNKIALILEYFNATSLKNIIKKSTLNIKTFLEIGIILSDTLGLLHSKNILHLDIKPNNILINLEKNIIKITDFGISKVITHENNEINNPKLIEGTLVYISPEQTGRLNLTIDHRADLYSLGISFYEMLTGTLPFVSSDPIEIIHSHIARAPKALDEINPSIPKIISEIVLKLMSKDPDERYQSAIGLKNDLQKCLDFINKNETIPSFELQQKDIMIKFSTTHKVFGRDNEIKTVMDSYDRISKGESETILVTGDPGIGKSSMVDEVFKKITTSNNFLISGKYEEFGKNVPYSAIIQAFKGLIRKILTENQEELDDWKRKITQSLGENAGIITNIIPEVELIIGDQAEFLNINPDNTQNIFTMVLTNFIGIFASQDHPLVLFLDDLQLADQASLNLIKTIISNHEINYFLLIGALQTDKIDEKFPIDKMKIETNTEVIDLKNLDEKSVDEIIFHTLKCEEKKCASLAAVVNEKTNGNPFFIQQFLKIIYDKKLIKVDPSEGWIINIDEIRKESVTDNVAGHMADKIAHLPEKTQKILKICSCIGNRFDLENISAISNLSIEQSLEEVTLAMNESLLYESGQMYHFYHDRIQKAAYSLLSEDDKSKFHYAIGNYVLQKTPDEKIHNTILYITDQLNGGKNQITSESEIYKLAALNLKAGKKAKSTTAYESALNYFSTGISLLKKNSWKNEYELSLALYSEAAETAYLDTHFEESENFSSIVLRKAKKPLDLIKIYETKIRILMAQNKLTKSISTAVKILKKFNIKIKEYPSLLTVGLELIKTKIKLIGKSPEDLLNLPKMKDPNLLAGFRIMSGIGSVAYYARPNMLPILPFVTVRGSIKKGNCPESAVAYAAYGLILASIWQIERGYEFGKMGIKLLESFNDRYMYPRVHFVVNCYVRHWKEHFNSCIEPLEKAHKKAIEVGDTEYAGHTAMCYLYTRFLLGTDLQIMNETAENYRIIVSKLKQQTPLNIIRITQQVVHNLIGLNNKPDTLTGEIYDENIMYQTHVKAGDHTMIAVYHFYSLFICYLFENYDQALINAKKCKKEFQAILGTAFFSELFFFDSLVRLALTKRESMHKIKSKFLRKIKGNLRKLRQWSKHAPMNYKHKCELIEAELAGINGDHALAMKLYDSAIDDAGKNGYINEQALAYELTAKYLLSMESNRSASTYMNLAVQTYNHWGAKKKSEMLKEKFSNIIVDQSANNIDTTSSTGTYSLSQTLDFSAIMNATLALSSEIELNKILEKIIHLSIVHGGAQRCFLIMENEMDKNLYIEASGEIDSEIKVLISIPVKENLFFSVGIVNYVHKLHEGVLLDNAAAEGKFINDPYVVKNKCRSILCFPIIEKGSSSVILYMENNLSVGAFSVERIKPLRILSTQAAISIENNRLLMHRENAAKLFMEMEIAAKIQTSLVPSAPAIENYEIEAYMEPADEVGGDYYDIINIDGYDWIIIGDVSGHGVSAGLIMMMVQTSIRSVLSQKPDIEPSKLLSVINRVIYHNINELGEEKYMTLTVMACSKDGQIFYSGLHQDILIYRAEKENVEVIETDGSWIGIVDEVENTNTDLTLDINDTMLIYTDGITEAWENNSIKDNRALEQMFGEKQLAQILQENGKFKPKDIVQKIIHSLKNYTITDDVTFVILRRLK